MSVSTAALDTPEGIATALRDPRVRDDPRVKRSVREYLAWLASANTRAQIETAHVRATSAATAETERLIADVMSEATAKVAALKAGLETRLDELREARRAKLRELELQITKE
jgi:hypothetical protein